MQGIQAHKETEKPRYRNRNERVGRREVEKILAAAQKLNIEPDDLAEMAGLERRIFVKWHYKWEELHNTNFCPRKKTFKQLWDTISSLTSQKDAAEIEAMRKQREVELQKNPAEVMKALTEDDLKQIPWAHLPPAQRRVNGGAEQAAMDDLPSAGPAPVHESVTKAPEAAPNAPTSAAPSPAVHPTPATSGERTAFDVIRGLLIAKIDTMTFIELALLLAHALGATKNHKE